MSIENLKNCLPSAVRNNTWLSDSRDNTLEPIRAIANRFDLQKIYTLRLAVRWSILQSISRISVLWISRTEWSMSVCGAQTPLEKTQLSCVRIRVSTFLKYSTLHMWFKTRSCQLAVLWQRSLQKWSEVHVKWIIIGHNCHKTFNDSQTYLIFSTRTIMNSRQPRRMKLMGCR